ncbi:MAG: hypothetical protein WA194_09505 [Patescibacteria group bacterium]
MKKTRRSGAFFDFENYGFGKAAADGVKFDEYLATPLVMRTSST